MTGYLIGATVIFLLAGLIVLRNIARSRAKRARRAQRRVRNLAHQRAWDWIFGWRPRRLTDGRDPIDR
jgi:hypothetical protein